MSPLPLIVRKEKFMLFSDHNGSLPKRQAGATLIVCFDVHAAVE